jgi:hypothetical protein
MHGARRWLIVTQHTAHSIVRLLVRRMTARLIGSRLRLIAHKTFDWLICTLIHSSPFSPSLFCILWPRSPIRLQASNSYCVTTAIIITHCRFSTHTHTPNSSIRSIPSDRTVHYFQLVGRFNRSIWPIQSVGLFGTLDLFTAIAPLFRKHPATTET